MGVSRLGVRVGMLDLRQRSILSVGKEGERRKGRARDTNRIERSEKQVFKDRLSRLLFDDMLSLLIGC